MSRDIHVQAVPDTDPAGCGVALFAFAGGGVALGIGVLTLANPILGLGAWAALLLFGGMLYLIAKGAL